MEEKMLLGLRFHSTPTTNYINRAPSFLNRNIGGKPTMDTLPHEVLKFGFDMHFPGASPQAACLGPGIARFCSGGLAGLCLLKVSIGRTYCKASMFLRRPQELISLIKQTQRNAKNLPRLLRMEQLFNEGLVPVTTLLVNKFPHKHDVTGLRLSA